MKRIAVIILFFIAPVALKAQEEYPIKAPNYDSISVEINNPESKFFYSDLYSRYVDGDSTLTYEDYHHLYYGYTFRMDYKPGANKDLIDSLFEILELKQHSDDDFKNIIRTANVALYKNPFELRLLNILAYAYKQRKDENALNITNRKLKGIFDAITNSGTGITCAEPMHVINISDSHEIIDMLRIEMLSHRTIGDCDQLMLGENPYNVRALHFNISKPLSKTGE